jgi:hypothetical protein
MPANGVLTTAEHDSTQTRPKIVYQRAVVLAVALKFGAGAINA